VQIYGRSLRVRATSVWFEGLAKWWSATHGISASPLLFLGVVVGMTGKEKTEARRKGKRWNK
jgi:hypothetical protein